MIDVRQLIPLEIQLQEYVSLFLYKLKTVNWIPSLILISGFLFSPESKSDTWLDPTWKQMLDSSEVVAMIQYTSNGSFRASAKVLAVYKGDLKTGDEIWISGFSNRYGPIDKVRYGDKYLVFLNRNQYVEQLYDDSDKWREYVWGTYHVDIETILMLTVLTGGLLVVFSLFRSVSAGKSRASVEWSALLMMIVVWCWHMGLRDLASAFKKRPAYSVSSPSSGDLKVYGDQVRYDLISTTYHREQSFYALETFESFLFAYYQKTNPREFCNILTDESRQPTVACPILND